MANILGGITGFFDKYVLGFALGSAAGPSLEPFVQDLANEAWSATQFRPIEATDAAAIAAEDVAKYDDMANEATLTGFNAGRFHSLYGVSLTAPGVGELLAMLRRDGEVAIPFEHGLRKAKLEPLWDDALRNLRHVRIPGPDLAYMVVRGVVPDGGTLPSSLPTHADNLALPPQLSIDTLAEAAKTGWDSERFAGLVARSGLAMGPVMAAQANFRGILTDTDYELTIARGDLFPAYAHPVKEVSRQILTAGEYAELQLRGYYDRATRLEKTAKHGMTETDSDLLYDVQGRGLSLHAAFIAERRGGVFKGATSAIPEWAMFQLQRGNLRPEVYNLAWAGRHSYSVPFWWRALTTAGVYSETEAEDVLRKLGNPSDLAHKAAVFYSKGTAAKADPHVTKADNQLWTTQHTAYVKGRSDDAFATETLTELGVAAAAIPTVLARWQRERLIERAGLTAAQIKKAYKETAVNDATGAPWTRDEAVAALMELGYSSTEARSFLNL